MKGILVTLLGFDWIENKVVKGIVRIAAAGIATLTAKYAWLAFGLTAFGLTPDVVSGGLGVLLVALIEWARKKMKHD